VCGTYRPSTRVTHKNRPPDDEQDRPTCAECCLSPDMDFRIIPFASRSGFGSSAASFGNSMSRHDNGTLKVAKAWFALEVAGGNDCWGRALMGCVEYAVVLAGVAVGRWNV
jgi:hypothetical protein